MVGWNEGRSIIATMTDTPWMWTPHVGHEQQHASCKGQHFPKAVRACNVRTCGPTAQDETPVNQIPLTLFYYECEDAARARLCANVDVEEYHPASCGAVRTNLVLEHWHWLTHRSECFVISYDVLSLGIKGLQQWTCNRPHTLIISSVRSNPLRLLSMK